MEMKSTLTPSIAESGAAVKRGDRRWWDPVRLARRSLFPALLQALALAVYVWLIIAGWGHHGVEGISAGGPLLYTNLATLGFWVVWFMTLVLLFPLLGRLWCTVCPVGGCNDFLARFGAKLSYPRRLQNFIAMAVLLAGLSLLAELFSFNRYPDYTAGLLLAVLLGGVVAGLVFKGRVFCRYWCPIGGMAGLFTRMATWEVGSRDAEVCRRCESKACYHGGTKWYKASWSGWHTIFPFRRPGCPASVFPPEAARNDNCLMCTQCFKNCPYDNLRWGSRPFLAGLWRHEARDRSQALLVIVLTGIVFLRLARFWTDFRGAVEWPATVLAQHLPFVTADLFEGMKLLSGFVFWPLLFFLFLALTAKVASEVEVKPWPAEGEKTSGLLYDVAEIDDQRRKEQQGWESRKRTVWGYLAVYCYAFLPLLAAAYGAFALIKLNEKLGYVPLALGDPAGIRTYLAINELLLMPAPESLLPLTWIRWVALGLVAAGGLLSLWSTGRIGAEAYGAGSSSAGRGSFVFRAGILSLGVLMLACLRIWLFRG